MNPISLTATAVERVKSYLAEQPDSPGLRLGVRKTGCSGWAYIIDLAKTVDADDQVFEQDGIRVIIHPDSLSFLKGMEVDFTKQGFNHKFEFRNPNVADTCGCGESFSVAQNADA